MEASASSFADGPRTLDDVLDTMVTPVEVPHINIEPPQNALPASQPGPSAPPLKSQQSLNTAAPLDLGDITLAARLAGQLPLEAGAPAAASGGAPSSECPQLARCY